LQLLLAAGALGGMLLPAAPTEAAHKRTDKREIEARQAFAAGEYQKALDLYAELYADKVHPTYLRNIGRCYQNLRQPEKAINAFRDYLRQAKRLTAAERDEVEGYISEMEELQRQQDAAASSAEAPPTPPPAVPTAPPVAPDGHAGTDVVQVNPPPPAAPPPTPFYKKAWFWSVVGVAVVGGLVGGLYAGGAFSRSSIPCTAADGCH
jgi:hypothetical protein